MKTKLLLLLVPLACPTFGIAGSGAQQPSSGLVWQQVGRDKCRRGLYLLAIYLGGQIPYAITRCTPKPPRSRRGLHSG